MVLRLRIMIFSGVRQSYANRPTKVPRAALFKDLKFIDKIYDN